MNSLVSQRSCGDCALCCHLGEIPGFKPFNQWCQHCSTHAGCDIYATRPQPCRDFHCHYLLSDLPDSWFPKDCGFIVSTYASPPRVTVSVDPDRPVGWQASPYIEQLMHWAQVGAVNVQLGPRVFAVYPEGIEELGELDGTTELTILEQQTPQGLRYRSMLTRKQPA